MKKNTDERLILKNLKNIRIAYVIQTIGIFMILAYDRITIGSNALRGNPLWFVFIISTTILVFSSITISVDHEVQKRVTKKSLLISIAIIAFISIAVGIFAPFTSESGPISGFITGGIFFICVFVPYMYLYYLRNK
ncbi:hypothetical protein ACFP65_03360 [Marinilactibacillus sp. GCM10026970]|uniref:hypothetical protein n=1 Tax=Marinilactibacillus sp. GCM10026970 TaxID=3252642 RepID=UPI00361A75F7